MTRNEAIAKAKESHAKIEDCVALCRVGNYYECYDMDALELNRCTGLTVVGINTPEASHVAGFPKHTLDRYLPSLVRAGNRVAIY